MTTQAPCLSITFPKQGHYANDPQIIASYPAADIQTGEIGDLIRYDFWHFSSRGMA
jgi:hypothetical protein